MLTSIEASLSSPCPICGVPGTIIYSISPATYYRCPVCETHYQHPMPTINQMHAYVEKEYCSGVYSDYVSAARLKELTFSRRARAIGKRAGTGSLLDVGASCGFFIEQALAVGFDAYGVELSSQAVATAPAELRRRITIGDVNLLAIDGDCEFDVVTAFDIIEHVFDPINFLASLRSVARSGTWIVITTPDTDHLLRHVLRARWPMYQPMQHTVLFSKRSLHLALVRAGYEVIEIGAATKTLTADYLATQLEIYLPSAVNTYRATSRFMPKALRNAPLNVNIGELMAFARVP